MKPGQVRYRAGKTAGDGITGVMSVAPEGEFRRTACEVIG